MTQQCEELRYMGVSALLTSDTEARDYFGTTATVDGNRLVVGATCRDTAGPVAGKVYVYDWNGIAYIEVAQLTASDAQVGDCFGISVSLSGNRLVVGAHFEDTAGTDAGKVYVYDWNGTAYVEVVQLTASDAKARGYFGISVALDGGMLVVGATGGDAGGTDAGKVYVYDWNGVAYVEVTTITASDAEAHDWFGVSVSLSGNRLVVGALGNGTLDSDDGMVYLYDWNGFAYVEVVTG